MTSGWQQVESKFQASLGNYTVEFNPARPDQGLVVCGGSPGSNEQRSFHALSVTPLPQHSLKAEEIYVRDSGAANADLIVRFGQLPSDEYAFQLNWRLQETIDPFSWAIESWISIQTRLLDSSPTLEIGCDSSSHWSWWSHGHLMGDLRDDVAPSTEDAEDLTAVPAVMTSPIEGATLLWLIDPRDQWQLHWQDTASDLHKRAHLFGDFLEKGVIRRARFQVMLGPSDIPWNAVQEAYRQLISSDLPLTA